MPKAPPIVLKNNTYDKLKPLVQIWLPATGALYFTLSQIWGLPAAEEVVGTIAAITTFLGVVLGFSSINYKERMHEQPAYDGALVVDHEDPMKDVYTLEVDVPLGELDHRDNIVLQVKQTPSQGNHGL